MSTPMRIISGGARGNSIGLVPGDAETHGGIDHADHAVGLREIPPQFAGARVDVLREQPVAVAPGGDALGPRPGPLPPTPPPPPPAAPAGTAPHSSLREAGAV